MKTPRVSLDQWRTLQAVVDHGGYAQAAEVLHRSQSSVSYTVARMQEQLACPLLRLEGRRAVLTDAGAVLLRRSRRLVQAASQLEELAYHMEQGWESEVRWWWTPPTPPVPCCCACANSCRKVVAAGYGCAKRCCPAWKRPCSTARRTWRSPAGDRRAPGGLLGTVEFVAVAHPEHPLHQLQRTLVTADLEEQLQIVIRDSGRAQPRDAGWLAAEQRWTVGSISTAATFLRTAWASPGCPGTPSRPISRRSAQAAAPGTGRPALPSLPALQDPPARAGPGLADPHEPAAQACPATLTVAGCRPGCYRSPVVSATQGSIMFKALLAACALFVASSTWAADNPHVLISTNKGDIEVELDAAKHRSAPRTSSATSTAASTRAPCSTGSSPAS